MIRIKIFAACLICSIAAMAQNANTPYSMYGYGILGDRATSMQRQMGGVGIAMSSGRQINVMNPASYAAIDSTTFLFDMGADVSLIWSEENGKKANSTGGGLDYVTLQFPICKFMGASVGLLPYSSVGYAFGNDIVHGTMENQGSGGINEFYLGVAGTFAGFSLGANFSYDFGTIVDDVFANPSTGSSKFEHVMRVRDWNVVIGAQYSFNINRYNSIGLGMTYSPKKSMHGTVWATTQEMSQESIPTEVARMKMNDNYHNPHSVGAGVSFTHQRSSRLHVEFDFLWQQWSKTSYAPLYATENPDKIVFNGMEFNDRTRYSFGAEFVPKIRGNYGQRMAYRIGAYYINDYLQVNSNGLREYGVTAGFGFPTPEGRTVINLGFEWKARQAHPNPMIKENYLNITLGVNFNEVWFFKRKIR
ncbi:MAG: hypothetical protein ACI303_01730 [Lepagella sp.]